jgi:PAS domain S-box-containing protein
MLDTLDGGVALLDQAGRILLWNDFLVTASGRTALQVQGKTLMQAFGASAGDRLVRAVEEALAAGTSALLSHSLNRSLLPLTGRDGSAMQHAASVKPLPVDTQRYCIVQVSDVTRVVERERLLRERRDARFRALVDAASDAILTTDMQGRILWINGEAVRRFGRDPAALEGASIEQVLGSGARFWTDPAAHTVEIEAEVDGGGVMAMELSLSRWSSDGRTLITGALRDIGERRRAEAEIASRHAEMAQLAVQTRMTLDALPASIAVLDEDGRILFVNRSFTALGETGVLAEGGWHVGEDYLAALASATSEKHPDRLRVLHSLQALLHGETHSFATEAAIVTPGRTHRFQCIGATIAGGPLGRAVYMLLDITEQKQLEDALRDLNATLEARVAAEIAARQRAQEIARHADQMRTLGQLAGGMAHDFNNVLQAISGGARLLARRLDRPEAAGPLIHLIMDAADRGASITGRLLSFAHRGELRADPVDTAALLRDLSVVLTHTLGSGILVQVRAGAALPRAMIDKSQLETVLINLATNARDAMPHGGRLLIAVEPDIFGEDNDMALRPGHYLRLSVADNGVGMDEATLARVSEPFFTTKPVGRGTGLGLAMARGFADQSGGTMRIASRLGEGTTIILWLPTAGDDRQAPHVRPLPDTVHGAAEPPPARVLLVDDEPLVREVLSAGLEDLHFDVTAAADGLTALRQLEADKGIDIMVTDLAMAEMDGMTLIRRARERLPTLPILLLTGFAEASPAALAESAAGQFDMLRKPVSAEQLATAISALLSRRRDRPAHRQAAEKAVLF